MGVSNVNEFLRNLTIWVKEQTAIAKELEEILKNIDKLDRLELLALSRFLSNRIYKTIKGFETWLQTPMIVGPMPPQVTEDVKEKLFKTAKRVLELSDKLAAKVEERLAKGDSGILKLSYSGEEGGSE